MTKKQLIVLVLLISIVSFQLFPPIAFGADATPTSATSSAISPTVTSDPQVSPTPSGIDGSPTPKPKPTSVVNPTATPMPKSTPVPIRQNVTETSLPTPTPTPQPTTTPTPNPNVASSINPSPTPPPSIAKTIVNFPQNVLSYIAPKNAYGASMLPQTVSLEFLAIGCALVAIGMLALRWEEGDRRVTTELKQMGVALRSWLL